MVDMEGVLTLPPLQELDWIEHGFGTRHSTISQDGMASLRQIHSAVCLPVAVPGLAGEGDALITNAPDLALSIRTADCLPILLADPVNRAIAAIHAGWRGTAGRIVLEALTKMRQLYGTEPGDVIAAIGPGIGGCCYEVGEDVGRQLGIERAGRVDLASLNRQLLTRARVPDSQIETAGLCTFCDARFYSYRREKDNAGRMISFIRIRK